MTPAIPFRGDHVGSLLRPAGLEAARNRVSEDDERRKLALVVETAAEVWGAAR